MSSSVEIDPNVARAVVAAGKLTMAAVIGPGWLAWQTGKLLLEANRAIDRQIANKKRQLEAEAYHRKMVALSAHKQLVDMCTQILSQLSKEKIKESDDVKQIKSELLSICNEDLPNDANQIENLNSLGFLRLEKVVQQRKGIAAMTMPESKTGSHQGLSVADLMGDIRLAIETVSIKETKGQDVVAIDPDVLERRDLNKEFSRLTVEIIEALETVEGLSKTYGLTNASNVWFKSCFNGIDEEIEFLRRPTTSNKELKKGICRLQKAINQYAVMAPSIERKIKRMGSLYKVYVDASDALGEIAADFKSFKNEEEIEEKLHYLQKRAKKAQECAEIYKKLGRAAYICYAWDQELKAMGYEVHTREKIASMANGKPIHAKVGKEKIPFYKWNGDDLTQLYSISAKCALQVIVNDDGSISLQTIAEEESEDVIKAQRRHCSQLKALHEKLRENWFIIYDYKETRSPEEIKTVTQWRNSKENIWSTYDDTIITDRRTENKESEKVEHIK